MKKLIINLFFILFFTNMALAEDINEIFKRVNEFIAQKNYSKAISELDWAKKEIEKMHNSRIDEFFPNEINGFKGSPSKKSSALGISNYERDYSGSEGQIKLALVGGSGDPNQGLGGLMQLGKMAAMYQVPGQESFRVSGKTAVIDTNNSAPKVSVYLDSGAVLQLDAEDGVSAETLKKFAEAIKVGELDTYLKGN